MSFRYLVTEPRDALYYYLGRFMCRGFGRHSKVCRGRSDHSTRESRR